MDEETVVESIIEIANDAHHKYKGIELLHEEFGAFGYTSDEINAVIEIVKTDHNNSHKSIYAKKLYSMLSNKETTRMYLNDKNKFKLVLSLFH